MNAVKIGNYAALGIVLAVLVGSACQAAVSAAEAAKLGGQQLTPVGAQRAGTADGRIPAWSGSDARLLAQTASMKPGAFYPDLFEGEKPLFRIDHANYRKYAKQLPVGATVMLAHYKNYYLNVYPTHRTAIYPAVIYKATEANATTARLKGIDALVGAHVGFPFPIPQTGAEVIWNHKLRYRGNSVQETSNIITVAQNGKFQVSGFVQKVRFGYGNTKAGHSNQTVILKLLRHVVSPPRLAGQYTLVIDHLDGGRDAWIYSPGSNRVLQAPTIQFDNPMASSDGLITTDQSDMFNGSMRQYNWKLIGKKLMYIPYNNYHLEQPSLKYSSIIEPLHLNPADLRYELHRVWVVDATLRKGQSNQFSRRVFYVDEDSWTIAAVDCYDSHGQLWRYEEGHILPLIRDKLVVPAPTVVYDLNSGRYALQNLINQEPYFAKFDVPVSRGYFTPQHMRRMGQN